MEIRIALVDDRKEDRDTLRETILKLYPEGFIIDSFSSAEEFLPAFNQEKYHIAFLDIVMDEMNGVELAKVLREKDPLLLIIFQTTSREYAFDAFPVHPFDYLMKPCKEEQLAEVLSEALRVIGAGDPDIKVSTTRGLFSVPLRNIISAASQGHNVQLNLIGKHILVSTETFKSISGKLESDPRFLLINRGVIINMDHVLLPEGDVFKMKDGSLYPIKVNGRTQVMSAFSQYMISRVEGRGL